MVNEQEVCRDYRQAKDKNKQILILADLNDTTPAVILDVLQRNGCISGLPGKKKQSSRAHKANAKFDWNEQAVSELLRLVEEGWGDLEIAERLGTSKSAINSKLYRLGVKRSQKGISVQRVTPQAAISEEASSREPAKENGNAVKETTGVLRSILETAIRDAFAGDVDQLFADYINGRLTIKCGWEEVRCNISIVVEAG